MNKYKQLLLAAAGLALCLGSTSSLASMMLYLSDGSSELTLTDTDLNGQISYAGSFGAWNFNLTQGGSWENHGSHLQLASLTVTSSGPGTLNIWLSDTDYVMPTAYEQYQVNVQGFTSGWVGFQNYADNTNAQWGQSDLLYSQGFHAGAFSDQAWGGTSIDGPFSLTTVATVSHTGHGQQMTVFNNHIEVPEPATLALLAVALLGLVFSKRLRRVEEQEFTPSLAV